MNLGKEDEHQEFKESITQLDEGIKSLTAMLNRHHRGTVYIGVRDDGEVIGMDIGDSTMMKIRNRIKDLIKPHIVCDIRSATDDEGKQYISITAVGSDVPYSYDGRYFIRNVASNESVDPHTLKRIVAGNNDILRSMKSPDQDLTFNGMMRILNDRSIKIPNIKSLTKSYGLMNEDDAFNYMAYILSDQNGMPVKMVRYEGTDRLKMGERRDYSGQSILVTVYSVLEYIKVFNSVSVDLSSGVRKETELFPFDAFREAWINACLHNDWMDSLPPSVYIFDDRIEVVSYGGLPYDLDMNDFFTGTSRPVNKALMTIFMAAGLVEQSGHGIPTIVDQCGREAFSFSSDMVTVTIRYNFEPDYVLVRKARAGAISALTDNQRKVYDYLRNNPTATLTEVSEQCGISLGGVKKNISKMKELGLVKRSGGRKNGQWIL